MSAAAGKVLPEEEEREWGSSEDWSESCSAPFPGMSELFPLWIRADY